MDDPVIRSALWIGGLSVILSFVALLTSRIYINTSTNGAAENAATEVDVPFFGKIKSNYPALALALLGVALAGYAVKTDFDLQAKQVDADATSKAGDDRWVISGRLLSPDGERVDWSHGVFTLTYGSPDIQINPDGSFRIALAIRKGVSLEEYLQTIDYSDNAMSTKIYPQQELKKFKLNDTSSLLENQTELTRAYKPMKVVKWNP
jgi:hypothetical protein